jgi:hypothetical protein
MKKIKENESKEDSIINLSAPCKVQVTNFKIIKV